MAGSSKTVGRWPLAFKEVGLNKNTGFLKLIAMTAMMIDHTGKMLFHSNTMRIVGRLAFPIYAYCIAVGCVYSKDHVKYMSRLALIAMISQPFYALALAHTNKMMFAIPFRENPIGAVVNFYTHCWSHPSVFLTLILGLLIIWTLRERHLVLTAAAGLLAWLMQGHVDYGWRGVALIVLFYLFIGKWWISLPIVFSFMFWWGMKYTTYHAFGIHFGIQMFAILALPLIYIHTHVHLKINKWVYYLFYPAHLICILLIEMALAAA